MPTRQIIQSLKAIGRSECYIDGPFFLLEFRIQDESIDGKQFCTLNGEYFSLFSDSTAKKAPFSDKTFDPRYQLQTGAWYFMIEPMAVISKILTTTRILAITDLAYPKPKHV